MWYSCFLVSQAMAISYATVYVHSCAPALSLWSSTECRQALKYFARKTISCCKHSPGIDYPVLVLSDRDRALALARQAAQWRKQQLTNVEKNTPATIFSTLELENHMKMGGERPRVTTPPQPGQNLQSMSEHVEHKTTHTRLQ